ncbi:uncharacterized protein METZ01_LOCUS389414, partial [marine metagenome]
SRVPSRVYPRTIYRMASRLPKAASHGPPLLPIPPWPMRVPSSSSVSRCRGS